MEFIHVLHSKDIFYKFLFYAVLILVSSYVYMTCRVALQEGID